ncbi:hypothetical protein ANN_27851 [Periplaneta americana]|uniref:Uncharacterized protein n=1 Tax=Periplaneta americana TaxID=6978 RepID=A0ABQ8RVS7_PERAM|nr:hypothetical protein ANN_27851 [Periplaneta americana]
MMVPIVMKRLIDDPETAEFAAYFRENYLKNVTSWAYCYRVNSGLNTNMHIERMHRTLKYIYLHGKNVKRLDKAINALISFMRDKLYDRLIVLTKENNEGGNYSNDDNENDLFIHIDENDASEKGNIIEEFTKKDIPHFSLDLESQKEKLADEMLNVIKGITTANELEVYKRHMTSLKATLDAVRSKKGCDHIRPCKSNLPHKGNIVPQRRSYLQLGAAPLKSQTRAGGHRRVALSLNRLPLQNAAPLALWPAAFANTLVMDLIKMELEVDPLALQQHDNIYKMEENTALTEDLLHERFVNDILELAYYIEITQITGHPARGRRRAVPPRFSPETWSVYELVINGRQHTNNVVEGFHCHFQRLVVAHHVNI